VQDLHSRSLATSMALSAYYVKNFITPLEVIRILNEAGVRFMLVGTHGLGGWMQKPRATEDVDVLVATRGYKKALRALLAAFPHLEGDDDEGMTRLRDRESKTVAIDVLKTNQQLYREALKHAWMIQFEGQAFQIPSLEMALVMKFARFVTLPWSEPEKYLDLHDFMCIAEANPDLDPRKLAELGDLVYPGGGREILEKVRQVRAGEKMNH
jgi:hypothetical protein